MNSTNNDKSVFETSLIGDVDLNSIPVEIEFKLASIRSDIRSIQELEVGSILPSELDLTEPIDISINGQTIGCGILVRIGDLVGVKILNWPKRMIT